VTTVADQFAEVTAIAGVKRIDGIVGDSLNSPTGAIHRQGKIEWIQIRHESGRVSGWRRGTAIMVYPYIARVS
jgi:thiamine pyrophosphate-dependent acetolactate synthase large subunit-like protein